MGSIGWSMVCHPSSLRIRICPQASSAQSRIGTVCGHGSTVCVLIRRRNSPLRRSMALVVRADVHCDGWSRVKTKRRSPASSRLSATMSHVAPSVRTTMANALEARFAQEGPALLLHLGGGVGVDHGAVVLGEFVLHMPGGMGRQVAMLVNRAALDGEVIPHSATRAASTPGAPSTMTNSGPHA